MIPCPVCDAPALTVEALFIGISLDCEMCGFHQHRGLTDALRAPLHAVTVAAIAKLREDYGLVVPPEQSRAWFADADPLEGLHALEGWMQDAARDHAARLLPPPVDQAAWQTARDAASADVADWWAQRLLRAILAADEARALSEAA